MHGSLSWRLHNWRLRGSPQSVHATGEDLSVARDAWRLIGDEFRDVRVIGERLNFSLQRGICQYQLAELDQAPLGTSIARKTKGVSHWDGPAWSLAEPPPT